MIRSLLTVFLCALAVLAADLLFRASVLSRVRPIILSPSHNAAVNGPVEVHWDGPRTMVVHIGRIGEDLQSLGPQSSPYIITADQLGRDGGYRVVLEDPTFGSWVSVTRNFQYHPNTPKPAAEATVKAEGDSKYLFLALDAARQARDKARGRSRDLRKQNVELRHDAARLQSRIQELDEAQDQDGSRSSELEDRLVEVANALRAANAENAVLRDRLASVAPCTAWGYYSYPRPQSIPVTRRIVLVSNLRGDIFRDPGSCESFRRDDSSAASTCFCVGNTFGE